MRLGLWLLCAWACLCLSEARGSRGHGHSSTGGGDSDEDVAEIAQLLKETDFVRLLEANQDRQDKRLQELHHRLEKELARVSRHYEEALEKVHEAEKNLQRNLEKVEMSVLGRVADVSESASSSRSQWKWAFVVLLVLLLGVAGFFGRLYRKATKHSHFL